MKPEIIGKRKRSSLNCLFPFFARSHAQFASSDAKYFSMQKKKLTHNLVNVFCQRANEKRITENFY